MEFLGKARLERGVLPVLHARGNTLVLQAQQPTGEIRLEVTSSGVWRSAIGCTARSGETARRGRFSDATRGAYTFANLAYGRYRLEVTKAGFATQSTQIDVQSGTPILRAITLALGTQSSRVDVVATTLLA